MKSIAAWAVFVALIACSPARADLIASATVSAQSAGSDYDYTVVLTNSSASTNVVGTFWFAWIPGQNYLATAPISVDVTPGWTSTVTHVPNSSTDGYAIRWVAATPLAVGESQTFKFRSADAPGLVFGNSTFYPNTPTLTFFVYSGAPFQGEAARFEATAVPEPSSLALAALGLMGGAFGLGRVLAGRRAGA